MKRIVRISTLFLLLALLGSATNVRAGVEPVLRNSLMGDSIRVDSFRIVEDVEYTNTNLGDYNLYKVFNYVTVEINQDQIVSCYLDSFCFSANVEITGWDETGTPHYDTGYFTVCYDQRTGMQYKGIQTKKLEGFYKVKIKVLSVSNTALTDYIRISAEIAIERYKDLDIVSLPDVNSSSYSAPTGDITVNWDAVEGAEEYDLEYTFVDNYNGNVGGTISASSLEVDFKNNASRVTVKGTSYAFSNVFEQGYVVFRVRAAGYTGEDFTWRVTGNWTNQGYTSALSDYSSHEKLGVSALEPEFNWQYVNTFSEGGKRKELISFMDGTFRNRQSVTRITSDETVIIGETMYDHQGRPALQILPVPFDSTRIMYYPNFSIDSLNPTNYTRLHFDTGTCEVISRPLKATSGASKYYSPNNPFLAQSTHWLSDHNPYIPSAEGMPFVRTVYTDDNSGRVALQSGVGPDHAIGSGHESKYFYGTPYQEEIDRLFGNNVGFAKHYQKQMVVDPNGQVSVSYTDLSGKVIATALAGEEPDNVAILTNNDGIREIEVQLIPYEDYSMPDPYTTLLSKKINVAVPSEYRLNYLLDMVSFQDDCMSACYECVYDLTISVKDECGEELLDGDLNTGGIQPFIREIKRVDSAYYSVTCAATTVYKSALDALIEDSMRVVLGVGSYTISKQLTVSEKAAQYFAGLYLADTSCVLEEQDFIDYHLSVIDDFGCEITCEECTEMLMDSAGYIATRKEAYENQGYFNEGPVLEYGDDKILQMAVEEYLRKKAICQGICNQTISPCEYMLVVMEVDVAPGGQYEELKGEVTSHPEYCRYYFCINNPQYALFEMTMDSITDGTRAMQLGFMNPLETHDDFPIGVHDVFFYGNLGRKAILVDELSQVISVPDIYSVYHDLDIWQSAIWISNYVLGSDTSPMYSTYAEAMATNNAFEEGRCGMKDPYLWEVFRALYKVARSRALERILAEGDCEYMSIPAGKTARFIPLDDVDEQTGGNESELETFTYSHCEAGCDSMSGAWMLLLGPCVTEHVSAGAIRAALINACAAGCGPGSPMGSSDGFQAVLESFGVYVAGSCDPRIISTPGPSGSSEYTSDASDQHCVCKDEDDPCLQMDADPAFQSVIRSLYYSSKEIECDSICYECLDIQNALIPFFEEVGDTLNILDSTANWPLIIAAHLNRTLKVSYDYDTYIDFIRSCANLKGINVDDDSVIRKFQELPEPGVISEEDYIDSINGVIQASLDQYYNPDLHLYSGGMLAEVEMPVEGIGTTRTYFQGAIPDIQYTAVTCPGYIKVNVCICKQLDALMDDPSNSALQDPSDPDWSTKWICPIDPAKIKRILEVCRTAYMSKAGKDVSDMDDVATWDQQAQYNLEDLVNAENLYIPASCGEELDCFSCSGPPYPPGVTLDPPDPIEYTPYLPCDSLLNFLDSFLKANESRLSKPLSPEEMQEIADSLDSRYSGEPYKRGETDASPADDPEYRKERLIAEVMRCTNDNLVGGCSNVSGNAALIRSYFSCDETTCYLRNGTSNLVQKWLRKETYLKKDSLFGDGFTSRGNLLWTDEHNLFTYNVSEYISTDLYEGVSIVGVDHYFYGPMHGTGPGPKRFWITDGTDSVLLWLAFFAPDKRYSLICNIRGVVSLDPYMAAPCDSTNRYNLEVIVETYDELTGERGMILLPMFGKTDRYELMDTCGVTPVLCGRSSKSGPLIGAPPKCQFDLTALARSFASRSYQAYADSVKRGFIHGYKTHCIGEAFNSESLTMRFDQQEYHYTLYYYDLAGNLIQTVPPQGVNTLSLFDINQANDFRQGSGSAVFASHDLPTTYMYNTLNELKWQNTPDGGSSDFWYDRLGRLVVSRNAKQKAYTDPTCSYTEYDALGRISEVGEVEQDPGDTMSFALAFGDMLDDWLDDGDKSQITTTYYDEKQFIFSYNGFTQNYLRNRVTSTTYTAVESGPYQSAVHYDYDVHGNVKAMVRDYPGLDSIYEQYKLIRYEYELVSGNVLKVLYQPDSLDRFFHRYEYDADNRVVGAYTSTDQVHWDKDAKYMYYLHGPMARTELGELKVQGMDFAYTLHGWLKGVNSERLRTSHDIGKDGNTGSDNEWVCPDVFGFGLGYYWDSVAGNYDYKSIGNISASTGFIINKTGSTQQTQGKSLYNGNIGIMVTAISKFMEQGDIPFGQAYQYDQLNRIKSSRAYNNVDTTNNKWKSTGSALSQYATDYTYDANGNILTLERKGKASQTRMDSLTYHYYAGTNRLNYVDDAVSAGNYGVDIDDQWTGNYEYDAIGNLVADSSEQIAEIKWTVYGKIQSIIRTGGSSKPDLQFEYSPDGHRIAKHVMDPTSGFTTSTWYVRDASGNIMATYEKTQYTVLDTSAITLSVLNGLVVTDWGAHVFSRFMEDGVELHTMMSGGQFTSLKSDLTMTSQLETALRMLSPMLILPYESTLMNDVLFDYSSSDFYTAMLAYYGSTTAYGNALRSGCNSALITHLVGTYYFSSNFARTLFTNYPTLGQAVWSNYNAGPYPGASGATIWLHANVSPVSNLYAFIGTTFNQPTVNIVTEFSTVFGTTVLGTAISSFGSLKSCTRTVQGDATMFGILDLYDRTELWDQMIANSSVSNLADMMISHDPGKFLQAALELNATRANTIFSGLGPMDAYHVTDYLNAILNYSTFGSSYYQDIVNQLMTLGYVTDGWNYSVSEHHIYGSSRVGVHKTEKVLRTRFDQGDIVVSLDDVEYTTLYRGKRNYELNNHLGNVHVIVSDKRISICDDMEVESFKADVLAAMDYYPFGMMMPDRQWYFDSDSSIAINGFNGMLKDDEMNGEGNSYYTEFRQYDSRLGRWYSVDLLSYQFPHISPYVGMDNIPILLVDPMGLNTILDQTSEGYGEPSQNSSSDAAATERHVGNLIIIYNGKVMGNTPDDFNTEKMEQDGGDWDVIVVANSGEIQQKVKEYMSTYQITQLQNVVIKSHGDYNYVAMDGFPVATLLKLSNDMGSIEAVPDANIRSMLYTLKFLAENIEQGGQIAFTACHAGDEKDGEKADMTMEVARFMGRYNNNLTILMNKDLSAYYKQEMNGEMRYFIEFNAPLTHPEEFRKGWQMVVVKNGQAISHDVMGSVMLSSHGRALQLFWNYPKN